MGEQAELGTVATAELVQELERRSEWGCVILGWLPRSEGGSPPVHSAKWGHPMTVIGGLHVIAQVFEDDQIEDVQRTDDYPGR